MPKLYSYVVRYDTGLAPNPFHGFCTLAVCKPKIRAKAQIGDWVVGTGSDAKGKCRGDNIVFAMRVTDTMTIDQYWGTSSFRSKQPNLAPHVPLEDAFGDNFYYRCPEDPMVWCQIPADHCDQSSLWHDTKVDRVLISNDFIYWGGDGPAMPEPIRMHLGKRTRGHRCNFTDGVVQEVVAWVRAIQGGGDSGRCGDPLDMSEKERHKIRRQNGLTD